MKKKNINNNASYTFNVYYQKNIYFRNMQTTYFSFAETTVYFPKYGCLAREKYYITA